MVDAGIGRLLIASLHQGIAEIAPTRLSFYENWLTPPGLKDTKFGLAPLHAVLSFLRREGQAPYEQIMRCAGTYSADWVYSDLSSFQRSLIRSLPVVMRTRAALYLSRRVVKNTFRGSRTRTRLRHGVGTMDIRASVFCEIRETADWPMCIFYSAAIERFLHRFDLDASVEPRHCKASGAPGCTMTVSIRGARLDEAAAEAA